MTDLPYTQIECKKNSLHQSQTGEWKISLTVQHTDMPAELLSAPMGQRMIAVFIALKGDEEPKPGEIFGETGYTKGSGPKDKTAPKSEGRSPGQKAVALAHVLCNDPAFQEWLCSMKACPVGPSMTAMLLRDLCDITSRADFAVNPAACEALYGIKTDFDHRDTVGR